MNKYSLKCSRSIIIYKKSQINKSYIGEKRTYEKLGKFPVARVAPIWKMSNDAARECFSNLKILPLDFQWNFKKSQTFHKDISIISKVIKKIGFFPTPYV